MSELVAGAVYLVGAWWGFKVAARAALKDMPDQYFMAGMAGLLGGLLWPMVLVGLGAAHLAKGLR